MRAPCIPYKGSKAKIAHRLMDALPSARVFYDLFAGGGAMTSAAMLSGKYTHFVMNDPEPGLTQLYVDAIHGKYKDEKRWINREDFFRLKDTDAYVRTCWSFGNDLRSYIYARGLEAYKKAYHYACVFNDYSLFHALDIHPDVSAKTDKYERKLDIGRWLKAHGEEVRQKYAAAGKRPSDLANMERLQTVERLQTLESLQNLQNLQNLQGSYINIDIAPIGDVVVYCDIPYRGTNRYNVGFDHDEFYEWCRRSPHVVYVSEYFMPDDFVPILEFNHYSTLSAGIGKTDSVERLFVHRRHADKERSRLSLI